MNWDGLVKELKESLEGSDYEIEYYKYENKNQHAKYLVSSEKEKEE